MKKISLFLMALCMSAMAMAEVAPKVTLAFTDSTNLWQLPTDYTKDTASYSYNNDTITLMCGTAGDGYKDGCVKATDSTERYDYLIMGKTNSKLVLPTFNFAVSKIVVYGQPSASGSVKFNVLVGEAAASTQQTGIKTSQTFLIDKVYQVAGTQFTIKVQSSHNLQITKLEVFEVPTGAPEVPVFSPKGGTYTTAQNVTLSCATDGAAIQYSFDGETYLDYSEVLQVESSQTIYAKAVKNKIESEVVAATYVIAQLDGDGSKENPYTIADLAILNNPGDSAWVGGYIIGCANSGNGNLITDSTKLVDSNVLLADSSTATKGLPVALTKADHKSAIGVATNRANVGKYLKVYGALVGYMGKCGVKNVSDYVLEGGATAIWTTKQESAPVKKMMLNGQMVIVRDGKMFNALGAEL